MLKLSPAQTEVMLDLFTGGLIEVWSDGRTRSAHYSRHTIQALLKKGLIRMTMPFGFKFPVLKLTAEGQIWCQSNLKKEDQNV